ncbi:hypothetical protein [Gimesia maris]|uniref:restriction endonuclease subunit S n=1 Tax=Gimesia maris TaxID=122 RepID=UPI003A9271EB
MSVQPYETYSTKDRISEWTGPLPTQWQSRKLKFVAECFASNIDKKSKPGEQPISLCNYTDVYYHDEITADLEFMRATATPEQIDKFLLRKGDTIITKDSEDPNDIAVPTFVPESLPGVICAYHLSIIRPNSTMNAKFLNWAFQASYARSFFATRANGLTRYGLGANALGEWDVPVPTRPEQKQIAAFLDYETTKIDALIEKQQQLIALLGEKRQAVISHAVTKGLNPDASLVKSGISWAPEVPAHWSLVPNRSLFRIRRVLVGQRHSEYQLLSLTKRGVIVRDVSTGDGKHSDYMERCQEVRPGDLVFCLFDVEETPRTIGLSYHLGMTSGDYTIMECPDQLAARFVEFFYIAMDDRKLLRPLYRGLRKRIPKPGFLAARIPLPPPKEQELIVQYLDDMQVKLQRLVEAANDQVELLQERRTALISAAVTGKIDVRGWKPPSSARMPETEMEVA